MQFASVYMRDDKFFARGLAQSVAGTLFATDLCIVISTTSTDDELGRSIEVALQAFRQNMQYPGANYKNSSLLDAADVKSWAVFMRGSQHLRVERTGHVLNLVPSINKGKFGFADVPSAIVEFIPKSEGELGERVRGLLYHPPLDEPR